jgi:hypothetical protein
MNEFIHIRSDRFPALEDEEQELVNEDMHGKVLGNYLGEKLKGSGYTCSQPSSAD